VNNSQWKGYTLRDEATEHVTSYHKVDAAVWPYPEVARSVGPTRCSNFVSAVFQQSSEVLERQIVPSEGEVHDEGIRVSQEQQHDGCTRREVNHATGHGSGCAVVTCGGETDSGITTGTVLDRRKQL
jgi:hypothetical protein